jgi:hypothetical protein
MKQCFKCLRVFPLSEFHRHAMMADGHLNKCKECACLDTKLHTERMMKDPVWAEKERERHRIKQQKRREKGMDRRLTREEKRQVAIRHREKYPEKHKARTILGNAVRSGRIKRKPCEICQSPDSEAHHDDYSKPLDVMWLCPKHHAERHIELRKKLRSLTIALI